MTSKIRGRNPGRLHESVDQPARGHSLRAQFRYIGYCVPSPATDLLRFGRPLPVTGRTLPDIHVAQRQATVFEGGLESRKVIFDQLPGTGLVGDDGDMHPVTFHPQLHIDLTQLLGIELDTQRPTAHALLNLPGYLSSNLCTQTWLEAGKIRTYKRIRTSLSRCDANRLFAGSRCGRFGAIRLGCGDG